MKECEWQCWAFLRTIMIFTVQIYTSTAKRPKLYSIEHTRDLLCSCLVPYT